MSSFFVKFNEIFVKVQYFLKNKFRYVKKHAKKLRISRGKKIEAKDAAVKW